jgi:tetratricopeptide (TPR) repeat protein
MSGAGSDGNASREWPPRLLIWAALALAVLAVYAPVRSFPFVVYDDKAYVSENAAVLGGLSREGVVWAFTRSEQGNYVPLTWLSHMLDVELFGLDAGRHHTVNALLHLLTALLLFEALRRMTLAPTPSAFVALLFAVHPTHVESVAWVAERRDTLSALFWMLTLLAYAGWADSSRRRGLRYAAVLTAFGLGLLAKPMLVTLPFVLLLLDFWPLRRASEGIGRLVLEKLPLLALAGLVSAAAVLSQGAAGAVATLEQVPLATRVANALVSYAAYLGKTLWPVDLAVFYPYALEIPPVKTAAALGLLVALSAAAWVQWRSRPYLAVGWLWYLGTLLPVIGIVQIGSQSMADRYTYLPTIGIAIAIAWAAADLASGRRRMRRALAVVATLALGACIFLAQAQVSTWRDSVALFEHARAVTGDNHVVHVNLAEAHEDAGRVDLALEHYREALRSFPGARRVHRRMGWLLSKRGQRSQAEQHFRESVRRHPDERGARLGLGILYLGSGRPEQAAEQLEAELALDPHSARTLFHLGELAALRDERGRAVGRFCEAFDLDPALPDEPVLDKNALVTGALAAALAQAGRRERAVYWASRALALARLAGETELAEQLERELASYRSVGSAGSSGPADSSRASSRSAK